jgi:hypothetical protein
VPHVKHVQPPSSRIIKLKAVHKLSWALVVELGFLPERGSPDERHLLVKMFNSTYTNERELQSVLAKIKQDMDYEDGPVFTRLVATE